MYHNYAGVRSSRYGINPFPGPETWTNAMKSISEYSPNSQPIAIWLVGEVNFDTTGMDLEFPSGGKKYPFINFMDKDRQEEYLKYFDLAEVKLYLQLEPGFADIDTLIDIVLNRFKHHKCIAGIGIDIEWYKCAVEEGENAEVSDSLAEHWEKKVKLHNSDYRLFLKHFDKFNLCPNYRGDIIFISDSQEFVNLEEFVDEMIDFADYFYPNTVMFQIGYPSDKVWWSKLINPPKEIIEVLALKTRQEFGAIWVDFSLKYVISQINK